ncbi:hypothetical protein CMI40_00095 [Candidatus Pacearchaeota archaeon]|jgi:hypothetical protein|nr:hypothetical protein [Candidatus Pacearchaeota archaeon]|tara:strand:- start:6263 stop:6523 length:261 start_codon:yes stop_codon:yes gene_type:complete
MDKKEVFEIDKDRLKVIGNLEVKLDEKENRIFIIIGGEEVYKRYILSSSPSAEYIKTCEFIRNNQYDLKIKINPDGTNDYVFDLLK